jgi:hypothetical protein
MAEYQLNHLQEHMNNSIQNYSGRLRRQVRRLSKILSLNSPKFNVEGLLGILAASTAEGRLTGLLDWLLLA